MSHTGPGSASMAAIDCVTWRLALDHEPAARELSVIGKMLRKAKDMAVRISAKNA